MLNKIVIITIIAIAFLSGCRRFDREYAPDDREVLHINKDQFLPRAYRQQHFDHVPYPQHTQESDYNQEDMSYEEGFQDGCQTATSAIGEGLARVRGPKIDADKLSENQWYLRGFRDASTYCTFNLDWETH